MTAINFTDVRSIGLHNKNVTQISYTNSGEIIWPTPSLPSNYTRGDFLQQHLSDNRGAHFSLPIGLTEDIQFEITLSFNTLGEEEEEKRNILGCYDDEENVVWGLQILNNKLYFNEELVQNFSLSEDTIYNIIILDNELRINGNLVHTSLIHPFEWNYLGLYDLILSDQSIDINFQQADINIYKVRIKNNGIYSYDCVPAENNNTHYTGLYDLIGQRSFYDNQNPTILTVETNF